ncbi:hypothetical protein [Pyruvatibacter sp. HU-CL02332]|uniref:hypothetical protein n=1 Tax=Pyruvatibacter sp. HU-CL02332 TaxID=3127650 RepID=UPI003365640F
MLPNDSSHATIRSVDFKYAHDASDLAAVFEITSSRRIEEESDTCGVQYEARLIEAIRPVDAHAVPKRITFGRHGYLEEGQRYILFLKYWENPEAWLNDFYSQPLADRIPIPERDVAEKLARCDGLLPGYQFDHVTYGKRVESEFLFDRVAKFYTVPRGVSARYVGDNTLAIDAEALLDFLRKLGEPPSDVLDNFTPDPSPRW